MNLWLHSNYKVIVQIYCRPIKPTSMENYHNDDDDYSNKGEKKSMLAEKIEMIKVH